MEIARNTRARPSIGLTPLIDMVFLLLVFFMLTTTFQQEQGLALYFDTDGEGLPLQEQMRDEGYQAVILSDGFIQFEQQILSVNQFREAMRPLLTINPDQKTRLSPDPGATVQQVMRAVDAVYLAGGRNIGFRGGQ